MDLVDSIEAGKLTISELIDTLADLPPELDTTVS